MGSTALNALLETAAGIGRHLAETAVWHEERCAWVGIVHAASPARALPPATARALGADLYEGTSGIGLFCAYLHRATGDVAARQTALGAFRHAFSRAVDLPPERTLGLYNGYLGVALAAIRAGIVLDEQEITLGGARLARHVAVTGTSSGHDLLSGTAGAVVGLLAIADALGEPLARERAVDHGQALAAATPHTNLTGMAHGAAGVAYALLELDATTGDATYAAAAAREIAWERSLFDQSAANWPDLRPRGDRESGDIGAESGMAWCHGAPGILLSRRRADPTAEDQQIETATRSVVRWTRAALASRRGNFSLCHGTPGVVEALLDAGVTDEATQLAGAVAELGSEEFSRAGDPWPCGTPAGETPGLMLGLAGIGLFYLRLADPTIPSVLAIGPRTTGGSAVARPR